MLAKLDQRIRPVGQRCAYAGEPKPWQKTELSVVRPMSGQQRTKRNDRIKLRDKWTCQCCGRITTELEIDHIVPLSQGGTEHGSNLQSLCAGDDGCHALKSKAERARK